ncbi:hypothetical protein YC2023_104981 [Brassica napus]
MKSLHLLSSPILHRFASRSITTLSSSLPRRRIIVRTNRPSFPFAILSRPVSSGKVLAMASSSSAASPKHTNRLAAEHSPYLLQHAHNPVDWYPWGEEAFEEARKRDVPIFLSIGYSTCHWCHVMEVESFESEEVAKLLNDSFVSIKVDREERPDVDKVYMSFVQALYGGGGWPLSVFLSPDLKPLMGGTYFPPNDNYGRPGFKTLLKKVKDAWDTKRDVLVKSGTYAIEELSKALSATAGNDKLPDGLSRTAVTICAKQLKEAGKTSEADEDQSMVLFSLQGMANGGMHDHVGGGFHRYSVDECWHVPHFEKMLYDQGQLANVYLDAEDADSFEFEGAKRKKEGAFYIWTNDEIDEVLGENADLFKEHYYVKKSGNCDLSSMSDPHNEFAGKNVLIERNELSAMASKFGLSVEKYQEILGECRRKLFDVRLNRPKPHLDDKIIVSWNGLVISALARASKILMAEPEGTKYCFPVVNSQPEEYIDVAEKAALFIRTNLYDEQSHRLQHSYRKGPSKAPAFLDDYAFLISGLLDLYENGGGINWLKWAIELQETQDELYLDREGGAYFNTEGQDPSVLLRVKEDHDGAEPSGNSVSAINLVRLASIVAGEKANSYLNTAQRLLAVFELRLKELSVAVPLMCCAADMISVPSRKQVVLVGSKSSAELNNMLCAAHSVYDPNKTVIHIDPWSSDEMEFWEEYNSNVAEMAKRNRDSDKVVALVCQHFTCSPPVSDSSSLTRLLSK